MGIFTVTFWRARTFDSWLQSFAGQLSANRVAILRAIFANDQVSKKELSELLGIGGTAIDKNLLYLREKGLLKRIGTKGGKWEITMGELEGG